MKKHSIHLISHALHNTIGSVRIPSAPTQLHLSSLPAAPVAWSVGKSISQPAVSKRSLTFAKINKISLYATFKLPNSSIYRKNNYTLSANTPTPFHFHTSTNHATISNTPATPSHNQQQKKPQPSCYELHPKS